MYLVSDLCDFKCASALYSVLSSYSVCLAIPPHIYISSITHVLACILGSNNSVSTFEKFMREFTRSLNITTTAHTAYNRVYQVEGLLNFDVSGRLCIGSGSYMVVSRVIAYGTISTLSIVACVVAFNIFAICVARRCSVRARSRTIACSLVLSMLMLLGYGIASTSHRIDLSHTCFGVQGSARISINVNATCSQPLYVYNATFLPGRDLEIVPVSLGLRKVLLGAVNWRKMSVHILTQAALHVMANALQDLNRIIKLSWCPDVPIDVMARTTPVRKLPF